MNQLHHMRDERIAQRSKATQSITPNFHDLSPLEVSREFIDVDLYFAVFACAPARRSSFDFVAPRMTLLCVA
jgi:hypothetical protein